MIEPVYLEHLHSGKLMETRSFRKWLQNLIEPVGAIVHKLKPPWRGPKPGPRCHPQRLSKCGVFKCVHVMFPLVPSNHVAFAGSCWRMLFFQVQKKKSKKCGGKNLIKCCSGLVGWVLRGAGIFTMLARPHVSTLDLRPDRKSCIGQPWIHQIPSVSSSLFGALLDRCLKAKVHVHWWATNQLIPLVSPPSFGAATFGFLHT